MSAVVRHPAFDALAAAAARIGATAFAVGGYPRDVILNRPGPDLDVLVEGGRAEQLAVEFARATGAAPPVIFERFGTAQVRFEGAPVEFVSARAESYAPESRKPAVRPASVQEDLERRDFTVNTLLMTFDGEVIDRLGVALSDIEARRLRTPRDPLVTIDDDPLRIMRALRFAAELEFTVEPDLLAAITARRERLRPPVVSVERVAEELRRLIVGPGAAAALESMAETAVLDVLFPEVSACRGVPQGGWHTHDVLGHTLLAVRLSPPDVITRLAALLHDVGKPACATPDGAFTGHEVVGARLAQSALSRLRFAGTDVEAVTRLVELHLRAAYYRPEWTDGAVRRLVRDAGAQWSRLLDLARADIAASAYPRPEEIEELAARAAVLLADQPARMRPPITGEDVMRELALPPGREVGEVKAELEELLLDGRLSPDREQLLAWLRARRR